MFDKILKVVWVIVIAGLVLIGINTYQKVEMAKVANNVTSEGEGYIEAEEESRLPYAKCELANGDTETFTMDPTTMQIWMDTPDAFLADLKDIGGNCSVVVTDGYESQINSSAGTALSMTYGQCRIGNPIECGRYWLLPDTYLLKWNANNDSAGFMATFRER